MIIDTQLQKACRSAGLASPIANSTHPQVLIGNGDDGQLAACSYSRDLGTKSREVEVGAGGMHATGAEMAKSTEGG